MGNFRGNFWIDKSAKIRYPVSMQIRNIGILAHVDAGKTTLTEQMLFASGAINRPGRVDDGTAHTDRLAIERRRGISVRAACTAFSWRDARIQLLDTPGHADFAAEVERALWALDGAVLLIDAADGVRPHTCALFQALRNARIPTILYLNKIDREGADPARALREAQKRLSPRVADYADVEALCALVAEEDEALLERYLNGDIPPRETLLPRVAQMTRDCAAYPALRGSALRGEGVRELLDAIVDLLPPPRGDCEGAPSGVVFDVEDDAALGRAALVRLFSGTLRNRESVRVRIGARREERKITQIRSIALSGKGADLGELRAGEIGRVFGLAGARVGSALGEAEPPRLGNLREPLMMARLGAENADDHALMAALERLQAENPLLDAALYGGAPHVRLMGAMQLDVLAEDLRERFGIQAQFGPPSTVYRETIRESATGFVAYTMPKPCWAVIELRIDPLPRGSGVRFESLVPVRDIAARYQHQIEQAIPLATRQGMLGWQVDDVKITLTGGNYHLIHTHPLDFIVATPMAFLDGLRRGGSVLLEPILELTVYAPAECAGRVISEIVAMRGEVLQTDAEGEDMRLLARSPAAETFDFPRRLSAITNGRGAMAQALAGYRDCPPGIEATCPRRGVHPLDTSKYILAARSALEGGIFDE